MSVLFVSSRPLGRCENITAIYEAYDGRKTFAQLNNSRTCTAIRHGSHSVVVTDEFLKECGGKTVVLVGHGITGGKLSGLDQKHKYVQEYQCKMIDYVISSGPEVNYISSKQCSVPIERVLALGMPRTDYYIGKKKGDGLTILSDHHSYLYAPTFRSKYDPPYPEIDFGLIDSVLTDNELFVVKSHMLMGRMLENKSYKHILEISNEDTSREYLVDCDVVITDYSSIFLDGYLLGKPCVLFEKNKGYVESRGMYFKYPDEYSSRYVCDDEKDGTSEVRLIYECRMAIGRGLGDVEKEIIRKTAGACDGNSTRKVCDFIKRLDRRY